MMNWKSLVLIAGVIGFAFLRASADPPAPRKDPQSSYEPRSGPGAGQKFLQQFVGRWTVVKTFYPRSGQPAVAKGECTQSMINDGRFLKSEFTFHADAGDSTGVGIIGFEPDSDKFTSVWTDSRQTRMSFRQSNDAFDGHEIHLVGKALGDDGKTSRPSHTISRLEDEGRTISHKQYTTGPDGKDRLVMKMVLTRQPK
jgi:hypothetical protein